MYLKLAIITYIRDHPTKGTTVLSILFLMNVFTPPSVLLNYNHLASKKQELANKNSYG